MEKFANLFMAIRLQDTYLDIRYGWFPFARHTKIPYRQITSVEVSRFTKRLIIQTNDGKQRQYALGGFGKAQRCRDAIVMRL